MPMVMVKSIRLSRFAMNVYVGEVTTVRGELGGRNSLLLARQWGKNPE